MRPSFGGMRDPSEPTPHGHALGAAVVIADASGRVLLVRHSYGRRNWEVPGGATEPGGSVAQTASREAREELGVEILLGSLVGVYFEPSWENARGMHHFVFRAELTGPLPSASPDRVEIAEWGWFAPSAPPRPISDFTLRRIRDAIDGHAARVTVIGERKWLE